MLVTSNKIMSFFSKLGNRLKSFFTGRGSVVRDLTRGDAEDVHLCSQGLKHINKKEINKIAMGAINSLARPKRQQSLPSEKAALLVNKSSSQIAGRLLSVFAASKHFQNQEIKNLTDAITFLDKADHLKAAKEAILELISELKYDQDQWFPPDSDWSVRTEKILQAFPELLQTQIQSPLNSHQNLKIADFLSQVQYLQPGLTSLLNSVNNSSSARTFQTNTNRSFVAHHQSSRRVNATAKLDGAIPPSQRTAVKYKPTNWASQTNDQIFRKVAQAVDDELANHVYSTVNLPTNLTRFTDIHLVDNGELIHQNLSSNQPLVLHANHVKFPSLSVVIAQMPKPDQRERFLRSILNFSNEGELKVFDLTNSKDFKGMPDLNNNNLYYLPPGVNEARVGNLLVQRLSPTKKNTEHQAYFEEKYQITDQSNGKKAVFEHVHFKDWPDHGVITVEQLAEMVTLYDHKLEESQAPAFIHCRAGVGRSGTISAALALYRLSKTKPITIQDLTGIIVQGRKERGNKFVQTSGQLKLLIDFFAWLKGRDSE